MATSHNRTVFYLAPSGSHVGLTSVALGLFRALDRKGVPVGFCKPIGQPQAQDLGPERSTHFVREITHHNPANPISLEDAERLIATGRRDELLETVVREVHESSKEAEVVVVEGLLITSGSSHVGLLNAEIARTLSADVILVAGHTDKTIAQIDDELEATAKVFGGIGSKNVLACILNHAPDDAKETFLRESRLRNKLRLLGAIPSQPELGAARTLDFQRHLNAEVLIEGELSNRRVRQIHLLARSVPNMLHTFVPGSLLITPADRSDVLMATALASMASVPLAGLILTGDTELDERMLAFCRNGLNTGLPVLRVPYNSWETATILHAMSSEIPADDLGRMEKVMEAVASDLDVAWLAERAALPVERRLSPAAFCYQIVEHAARLNKLIVLPEGDEPRTIQAAADCARRGIARCMLLGNRQKIMQVAEAQAVQLSEAISVCDPHEVRQRYVAPLMEFRKSKGLTEELAREALEDNVYLGTVMLALGEVDGLVSGAVHSSANTIRPALQIIKTKPDAKVVSSIFFMCLPDQVLVYGDCAVNPDPDAEALADIAIQSADSAIRFGIPARVALISYSTGESGSGADVEKVRQATQIAKEIRPDLCLDGPLQYDAAAIMDVAEKKAPNSPVAGRATVFVFPDLNTGNTTYKAVQRSANVISIGPMLQGLRRPVNDLSRGALIEDIVYTIAITAIQASDVTS
ncbi:MAG: phosphate acetyltransferase [Verrucomicrobiales bacterium]